MFMSEYAQAIINIILHKQYDGRMMGYAVQCIEFSPYHRSRERQHLLSQNFSNKLLMST